MLEIFHSRAAVAAATLTAALTTAGAFASIPGDAGDHNALIFGDVNYQNTDFEGSLAVGGNVTFTNMGVASQLPNSNGAADHMIVGGNVNWTNGQVYGGNLSYGGTASLSGVGFPNGSANQGPSPIDFAAQQAQLTQASTFWSGLSSTGTADNSFGAVTLTGSESDLNIFNLDGSWLSSANGLTIDAPTGSTVLINVDGSAGQMQNFGFFLNGISASDILFNFHEADTLNMSGIGVEGSILAPNAAVDFANGQMNGTLIANSLVGSGEFHHHLFDGDLPPVPAPAAFALLGIAAAGQRRRRA